MSFCHIYIETIFSMSMLSLLYQSIFLYILLYIKYEPTKILFRSTLSTKAARSYEWLAFETLNSLQEAQRRYALTNG